jgi:hypothetical protein
MAKSLIWVFGIFACWNMYSAMLRTNEELSRENFVIINALFIYACDLQNPMQWPIADCNESLVQFRSTPDLEEAIRLYSNVTTAYNSLDNVDQATYREEFSKSNNIYTQLLVEKTIIKPMNQLDYTKRFNHTNFDLEKKIDDMEAISVIQNAFGEKNHSILKKLKDSSDKANIGHKRNKLIIKIIKKEILGPQLLYWNKIYKNYTEKFPQQNKNFQSFFTNYVEPMNKIIQVFITLGSVNKV